VRPGAEVPREVSPPTVPDQTHLPSDPRAHAARKIFWFLVRLAIAGILLAYLAKSGLIDLRALSRPFTAWPIPLVAVALVLFDMALMGWRLSLLFQPRGMRLPWRISMQLTLVGFFFAAFLPGAAGGDFARVFYTARNNKDRLSEIVAVTLFDRAIGLFSLLIMPLVLVFIFPHFIWARPAMRSLFGLVALLAGGLLLGFLFCLYQEPSLKQLTERVFWFLPSSRLPQQVVTTIAGYRDHARIVTAALALSLLASLSLAAVMLLGVQALKPGGVDLKMLFVVPLGFVANNLPLTPGGLGVGEEAFNTLFTTAGFSGGAEALICWRIWTGLVRMLGLGYYLRGVDRRIFDGEVDRMRVDDLKR
jgi:hypothetical protein